MAVGMTREFGDAESFPRERLGFEADAKQLLVLQGGRRGWGALWRE
jgi:hypothetical protein